MKASGVLVLYGEIGRRLRAELCDCEGIAFASIFASWDDDEYVEFTVDQDSRAAIVDALERLAAETDADFRRSAVAAQQALKKLDELIGSAS